MSLSTKGTGNYTARICKTHNSRCEYAPVWDGSPTNERDGYWNPSSTRQMCLTGCAVGEVLGMVIGTSFGLHNAATVVLSILLAFMFGYALTVRGMLTADTVSIAVMEVVDNTVIVAVPGAITQGSACCYGVR
jgi:hypothetical protein